MSDSLASVTATIKIKMYLTEGGPGFVDVSEDVVSGVRAQWGIQGNTPKHRVAEPGNLVYDLDDSSNNSAGLPGLYTFGHVNCRAGFKVGTVVGLFLEHPLFGEKLKWLGTVSSAPRVPGVRDPRVTVTCVDWMEEAARARPSFLPVMVDTQADQVFLALLASIDRQPEEIASSAGSDLYAFALDNMQDESSTIAAEFEKLALSEFGVIYLSAGRLVFEGRSVRATARTPQIVLDEDDNLVAMEPSHQREDIFNRIQVTVHPRRRDASPVVLFSLESPQRIERGTSIEFDCPYRDPDQTAQRVGGIEMVDPPVATTDYTFNSQENGLGTNLTSQLLVVMTFGGNSAHAIITNNGPADGYIPAGEFRLRGRGLYDDGDIISDVRDQDSIDEFGENPLPFDMPYQSSPDIAADTSRFLLFLNKDEKTRIQSVTFMGNWDEDMLLHVFDREISDLMQIVAPSLAVDDVFYINGISLDISIAGAIACKYIPAPANTAQFWTLEVDGATELDETTVLGYGLFVSRWILGTDVLGTSTFLN